MPFGNVLVMVSAAGAMVIVSFWLAFWTGLPESVTFTVIVEAPAVVGVPLTVHPESERPAGRAPVIEHAYGMTPPVAPICALYGTPTVPSGSVLVNERVAGAMVMVSLALVFCAGLPPSVTVTRTVTLPATVGVPLTVHAVRLRPAGSAPVIAQLYGVVPPVAVMFELYAIPTVPFGNGLPIASAGGAITIVST